MADDICKSCGKYWAGCKCKSRKIVQIAGSDNRIYALADDGSLWEMNHDGDWTEHPPLPDIVRKK